MAQIVSGFTVIEMVMPYGLQTHIGSSFESGLHRPYVVFMGKILWLSPSRCTHVCTGKLLGAT